MPDSDPMSRSDSDIFMEETAAAGSYPTEGSSQAEGSPQKAEGSPQVEGSLQKAEGSSQVEGSLQKAEGSSQAEGSPDDMMADEIRAAREALEQAAIALQRAGVSLEGATTDQELAAAEAELARARLSVIVAGQDLMDTSDVFSDTPGEDIFNEAGEALNEANVAIVIATEAIFDTHLELPDFDIPDSDAGQSGLDKELNESIAIFEGRILDARNQLPGSAPPPTSAEKIPGVAVLGGTGTPADEGGFQENGQQGPETGVIEQGRMPEGAVIAKTGETGAPPIPEDIPDPQGDDIVARQIREAAIAATDPALKEKLWEEYKNYRAGL